MPKPLRVKIFMGSKAGVIEEEINAWLDKQESAAIIKMETVVAGIAEKPNDATHPCIVVTVWYEPPGPN